MKLSKLPILLTILSTILNSCSGFGEAGKVLRNEKTRNTDEFLIKKKEPLIQPPDFDNIPEPGTTADKAETGANNIERILKKNQTRSNSNQTKSSSTEESILKQIQK
jgi:hypothetical protein|tara:strand:+ start:99 stop:419 length:321 start_codon:yes stop_codon:yes gene_type:complete